MAIIDNVAKISTMAMLINVAMVDEGWMALS